jgi:hypothetical protein
MRSKYNCTFIKSREKLWQWLLEPFILEVCKIFAKFFAQFFPSLPLYSLLLEPMVGWVVRFEESQVVSTVKKK